MCDEFTQTVFKFEAMQLNWFSLVNNEWYQEPYTIRAMASIFRTQMLIIIIIILQLMLSVHLTTLVVGNSASVRWHDYYVDTVSPVHQFAKGSLVQLLIFDTIWQYVYEIVVPWSANVCYLYICTIRMVRLVLCNERLTWHSVYIWLILLHLPSFHLCLHLRSFDIHAPQCKRNGTPNGESQMNGMRECWRGRKSQLLWYHCVLALWRNIRCVCIVTLLRWKRIVFDSIQFYLVI